MRRFLLSCLLVLLAAAAIHSIKAPILVTLAGPPTALPIASIGDVFRHF
ncbi:MULTISPECIES: hypothetical protein [unclassified Pseudomonas]|nr:MULTISPECIES: hypothetical protein [unclassified Pseudomonas]